MLFRGLRLETETEPGRVNAFLILCATVVILAVAPNTVDLVIGLWSDDYSANFPLVPVVALLLGGGLICVLLLVILEPLLQPRRPPRDKD